MKFFPKHNRQEHHPDMQPPLDPMKLILETLDECTEARTEIKQNTVRFTDWNITVSPTPQEIGLNNAIIDFHVTCTDWDDVLFECCAAVGKDTRTAIGMACSSFLFAFIQGIHQMMTESDGIPLESSFAGKTHRWKAYVSDTVGLGEGGNDLGTINFWDLLKDHIVKRLGNQKMCYVKIYAAKGISKDGTEQITGECRIDDVPSAELSRLVEQVAAKWNVKQFSSQKQFFFIRQDKDTLLPNEYSGVLGRNEMRKKVRTAVDMIQECHSDKEYNTLLQRMKETLKDATFAEECFCFLAEICGERAFNEHIKQIPETLLISVGDAEPIECYKNQLADYYPLGDALFYLFDMGVYGDDTNDIYRRFIGASSIYGAISKVEDKDITKAKFTALYFNPSNDFEIR